MDQDIASNFCLSLRFNWALNIMYIFPTNHSTLNTIQLVLQADLFIIFLLYSEQLKMWDNGTMAPHSLSGAANKLKIVVGTKYFYACAALSSWT